MKKIFALAFLALAASFSTSTNAQTPQLKGVDSHRLEITTAQDDRIKQEVKDILAPYKAGVDSLVSPVLGVSEQYMEAGRPESLLGNVLCDILVDVSRQYGKRADLAILNKGGLRSAMPKGQVTIGDIMEIAPFENTYTLVSMQGDILEELMRQIASLGGECVSKEVRMVIGEGGTMKSLTINGKKVNRNKMYRIATLDYLAEGNDGMTAFRKVGKKNIINSKVLVRDVYMNYLRNLTKQGKTLSSRLDGRISLDSPATEAEAPAAKAKPINLMVVHTNDTHSCVMPYNPNSSDKQTANKGGYLRRTVVIDSLRQIDPELLLLDDGDFSQGSAYYNLYKGDVETDLMNYMRYDACTIGNHEFDFGLENMARLFRRMKFPVVCCNYDFTDTPVEGTVRPYTILTRKGIRIGITGVGPELDGLVSASKCQGVRFLDPATEADKVGRYLKETEHCDFVICLSHLGVTEGDAINDQNLVAKTHYLDAVVSGHSHTYFDKHRPMKNADGRDIPVQQEGKNARFVGILNFTFEK